MKHMGPSLCNSFSFENFTEEEVKKEIHKLKSRRKASLESFNPAMLSKIASQIGKPLTYLYNLSINTGVYPASLKLARVIPIYKKESKSNVSNYRPLSLLSIFDKIFEKMVGKR